MKIKLIMNPASRSGKGRSLWTIWKEKLSSNGIDFEAIVTSGPGDAFEICRTEQGNQTLVAVGGDGTINEVLDGIAQSGNPGLRMGVLYSGTSPDFCRFHGIPTDPEKAVCCLLSRSIKKIDIVQIDYVNEYGGSQTAFFACGCNIGLGAKVADFSNRWRKILGDRLGTGLGVVRAIVQAQPFNVCCDVDGIKKNIPQINNISILKNPHIASGLKLNINLKPDDGRLALVAIHGHSRRKLCKLLPGFYSGEVADSNAISIQACSRVCIRSNTSQKIEFDGDPRGFLPITATILPRSLNLVGASHD